MNFSVVWKDLYQRWIVYPTDTLVMALVNRGVKLPPTIYKSEAEAKQTWQAAIRKAGM